MTQGDLREMPFRDDEMAEVIAKLEEMAASAPHFIYARLAATLAELAGLRRQVEAAHELLSEGASQRSDARGFVSWYAGWTTRAYLWVTAVDAAQPLLPAPHRPPPHVHEWGWWDDSAGRGHRCLTCGAHNADFLRAQFGSLPSPPERPAP